MELYVGATSCEAAEATCVFTSCVLLPYLMRGVFLVGGGCTNETAVIEQPDDLVRLEQHINRVQKTDRAPAMFELTSAVRGAGASSLLREIGMVSLHTWNILLFREAPASDPCADVAAATQTIFTVSSDSAWCVDLVAPAGADVVGAFNTLLSPMALARATLIAADNKRSKATEQRKFSVGVMVLAGCLFGAVMFM